MSRTRGPRSTKSPTKTALRPSGWTMGRPPRRDRRLQRVSPYPSRRATLKLVGAAVDIADDVERPMLPRPSFQSGTRSTTAASTSSGVSRTKTCRKPSFLSPLSDRRSCDVWLRTTCGPNSRSARSRSASDRPSRGGRRRSPRAGSDIAGPAPPGLAGLGLDVGGVDDRQSPQRQPLAAMNRRTSKASLVTPWSFSSSPTIPRQKSEERISVERKCLRANVLLPEPLGPMRTTRLRLGILIFMSIFYSDRPRRISAFSTNPRQSSPESYRHSFVSHSGATCRCEQEPGGVEPAILAREWKRRR